MHSVTKFMRDLRGDIADMVVKVIIVLFLAMLLIPIAMNFYTGTSTTGWKSSIVNVWDALPVIAMIGIAIGIIYFAIKMKGGDGGKKGK